MANLQRDGEKERFWRGVLSQYALSGLSVRAFCQGEGLAASQFYRWRRTIGLRDGVVAKPPSFVPVVVAGHSAGASSIALELIGGRVLRLPASTPAAWVAELVLGLEASPVAGEASR
jgi:transposase-like protein